jgi:hypothetical protein
VCAVRHASGTAAYSRNLPCGWSARHRGARENRHKHLVHDAVEVREPLEHAEHALVRGHVGRKLRACAQLRAQGVLHRGLERKPPKPERERVGRGLVPGSEEQEDLGGVNGCVVWLQASRTLSATTASERRSSGLTSTAVFALTVRD